MFRVAPPLLVWPLALFGTGVAIALSTSGLLSLVAAHAGAPAPLHARPTMPAPQLLVRQTTPVPEARPVAPAQPEIAVARTPMAKVGPAGAVLRGAAGAGALAVWQLRPGSTVVVLASRGGWSEIDQQGLVGWIPTSALSD